MRSDGATCGYCGCLPTRHSKKDACYSSDSVDGTSAVGTSESTGPEKRKDKDLGWFPKPKGEYSDVVDRVVGSNSSSLSDESSPETDFIPEPHAETSKYGQRRARVQRDNYVSWEKIVF